MYKFILLALLASIVHTQITTCHYTCSACTSPDYYSCTACTENRGKENTFEPIAGMCYCINETDENDNGECTGSNEFNYNNKAIIASFIGLCLFLALIISIITGMRYYLIKTIEDVQEISLLVFLNMYFPQQFDIFLTHLYRFNISSYTFQSLASGSLFEFETNQIILSTDGQNIYGKYKLLLKTANFFSNQFTWILVFVSLFAFALIIRFVRNRVKAREEEQKKEESESEQSIHNQTQEKKMNTNEQIPGNDSLMKSKFHESTSKRSQKEKQYSKCYKVINRIYNTLWLNFFIVFFYLSLIEININVFTQISNLTFSSSFAAAGAFFSALFMALEFVILVLLAFKIQEETIKPQWMRDYTYTAPIYLVKTNYKTITKYFWFFSCIKKILIALMITVFYEDASSAMIAISAVEATFICFSVYCQPFQKRYLRIHFYLFEGFKLFTFLSLINFSEKYIEYIRMIEMTKLLYIMLAIIFGFNLVFMIFNMIAERGVYIRTLSKFFCPQDPENDYLKKKRGYYSEGKLYIYQKQ